MLSQLPLQPEMLKGQLTGCQRHLMAALKTLRWFLAAIQKEALSWLSFWGNEWGWGREKEVAS